MKFAWMLCMGVLAFGSQSKAEDLPKDLKWETNNEDPMFASTEATIGGHAKVRISTFPLTFRTVGPDANTVLYSPLINQKMSLTSLHPNTFNPIPSIATHWAYGKDGKTVYYKLNKAAKWSDGKPVTADDFVFTLEFMTDKNLVAPFYNTYYSNTFEKVIKFDDHTLAVRLKQPKPPLVYWADLSPTPKHFYGGKVAKDFVTKYNWEIVPNPGPYQIDKFRKGKYVTMKRNKKWWGNDLKYFKHRFNVEKVTFKVVREDVKEYELFKAGELDFFALLDPKYYYDRADEDIFKKGYVGRLWFYDDAPRSSAGLWLNKRKDLFKDKNVRIGIQHALNFKKVIETQLRNEYSRLNTVSDGYRDYWDRTITAREFDLKKAEAAFKKAGWEKRGADGIRVKGKQRLSATVMYSSDLWTPRLVVLKEEAKKAGFELNLQRLDWSAVVKGTSEGRHEIVLSAFTGFNYPQYWGVWHSEADDNNMTGTSDKELDKLIDTFRYAGDETVRKETAKKIQRWIHEDAAFIPAVTTTWTRVGFWRWWKFPKPAATRVSKSVASLFDNQWGGLLWYDKKTHDEVKKAMSDGKELGRLDILDDTYKIEDKASE